MYYSDRLRGYFSQELLGRFSIRTMMSGYIKLHRVFQKWEWRDDANCVSVFIDLLHQANYVDGSYRGIDIPKGSLTTSQEKIGQRTGLSISQVRTVLDKLSLTGEIAVKITNKYSMISILKWDLYQGDDRQDSSQIALQSHSNRTPIATSKKLRNKEVKNTSKIISKSPLEFMFPDDEEIRCWLRSGSVKLQNDILATYQETQLREEIKKAYYWQEENTKRAAGAFLSCKWLPTSKIPKKAGKDQAEVNLNKLLSFN